MSDPTAELLHDIEHFLVSAGMAETTFGQKAVRDTKLVSRLRNGRSVTLKTAERIRSFMRQHSTPAAFQHAS